MCVKILARTFGTTAYAQEIKYLKIKHGYPTSTVV